MNAHIKNCLSAASLACLLAVSLTGCGKTSEPTAAAPVAVAPKVETTDADVTTGVKTALLNDEALKKFDIAVVTSKGDVRLTGVVDNQGQIDSALKLARSVEGTHSIHDELTIKK